MEDESQENIDREISELRETLEFDRVQTFQWDDAEFEQAVLQIHSEIGTPMINAVSVWDIYVQMLPCLKPLFGGS